MKKLVTLFVIVFVTAIFCSVGFAFKGTTGGVYSIDIRIVEKIE